MDHFLDREPVPPGLQTLRIIVIALILGVVAFAAVASVVPPRPAPPNVGMLRLVLGLMLVSTVPAAAILRHLMLRGTVGAPPSPPAPPAAAENEPGPDEAAGVSDEQLFQRFNTGTIISCALLEGTSLFGVVLFFLSRDPIDLALAAAPLVLLVGAFFPTDGRWRRFRRMMRERR